MSELTKENFDHVLDKNEKLLIYFYRKGDAASVIGFDLIDSIEQMVGRDFEIFTVNTDLQPDICHLFSIKAVPEYICVKNRKIHKRALHLKYSNHILDLLK